VAAYTVDMALTLWRGRTEHLVSRMPAVVWLTMHALIYSARLVLAQFGDVPPIPDSPKWIEPDALFAIDDRMYAIEADMGTESIETLIKGKIRAYREIVASRAIDDQFAIDNLKILFVTTNEKRMRNMMAAVASIAREGRSTMFGFACRADLADFMRAPVPNGRMFSLSWRRVGFDDLLISSSIP
jgi:hypothetical protein